MLSSNCRRLLASPTPDYSTRLLLRGFTREYHVTSKREILPLVIGVGVLAIGRYSWRAMKRMEDEWEDYEWLLQEYEKKNGPTTNNTAQHVHSDGTIAIDIGTIHVKMAHAAPNNSNSQSEIIANQRGGRYTFAGVVEEQDDELLLGQRALDRFFLSPSSKLPYKDTTAISPVLREALNDVLAQKNSTNLRQILTLSPMSNMADALLDSTAKDADATLLPDPVAAIWGAEQLNLFTVTDRPVVVVDIGGYRTTVSVVLKNILQTFVELDFGGQAYVDIMLQEILKENAHLSKDHMAMQRLHVAAMEGVYQYNAQTQATLHIPYISMDTTTRQPQHLDITISRSIIENQVQEHILKTLSHNALSSALPTPTDLRTTWMSVLTLLLTHIHMTPQDIQHVLLVGGGAKQHLMEQSLREAWQALHHVGHDDIIVPQDNRSELVALGAASMLPNYDYSPIKGLVRR